MCSSKDNAQHMKKMKVEILCTASNNGWKAINQNDIWIHGRMKGYHEVGEGG